MNAEFQWWLLILGIVIGGALVYIVLADLQGDAGREEEAEEEEGTEPPAAIDAGIADRSVADSADVEGDRAQAEATVADVDETRPGHRRGQRHRVGEPLE